MPEDPNATQASDRTTDLSDAPGGDIDWDTLFPPEGSEPLPSTTTAGTEAEPAKVEPAPSEPFLKGQASVYKTADEAVKGINQKDALIADLRAKYAEKTGFDPITNESTAPAQQETGAPVSYLQSNEKYFADLEAAVKKGDKQAYFNTQAKLVADMMAPAGPIFADFARSRAVESVESEVKGFREFLGSDLYKDVLEAEPELKQAIEVSSRDFNFHERLPGLYRLAYYASQGRRLPELLKSQQTTTAPAATPSTPTTTGPSTLTPPDTSVSGQPSLATKEGRKAIIDEALKRGVDKLTF